MEREELLQQVQVEIEEQGRTLSPSLSEESINGELEDELENFGEDEEANKKLVKKIAGRLLRMDGNIHSNVSREVDKYKKKNSQKPAETKPKDGEVKKEEEGDEMPAWAKALSDRLDRMDERSKARDAAAAKDEVAKSVERGLMAKFKTANIEVNGYIFKQTLRDMEIPDTEDGEKVNEGDLIGKMERAYYRNLKEAGLDKKDTSTPRFGGKGGNKGESAADRFFAKKGKKEGWRK